MTFSVPKTWNTTDVGTSADWNTYVRDQFKAVAGADRAACRVYNSAVQALTTAVQAAITFDTERFDTQSIHSTVSNTSRLTVPASWGGIWLIGGCCGFAANATGSRSLFLKVNNTTYIGNIRIAADATASATTDLAIASTYALVAGDYVELIALQSSGGNLNTSQVANSTPEFWMLWMGTG